MGHFRLCLFMFSNVFLQMSQVYSKTFFSGLLFLFTLSTLSVLLSSLDLCFSVSHDFCCAFACCSDWFLQIISTFWTCIIETSSPETYIFGNSLFYSPVIDFQGLFGCGLQSYPVSLTASIWRQSSFLHSPDMNLFSSLCNLLKCH